MKLVILVLALIHTAYAAEKPKRIFLFIGQSNMAGRAPNTEETKKPIKNALLLNKKGEWISAANPLNIHSTIRKSAGMQKVSIAYSFAKEIAKNTKEPIGLIVNARGGSKIEQWSKNSKFFKATMKRLALAEKAGGKLEAVLWHQGESNANDKDYGKKLTTLVKDLRNATKNNKLPFIAGEVREGTAVNKFIQKLPTTTKHTTYVSSKGLTTMDRWHFGNKSILTLGKRYAEAYTSMK